MGMWHGNFEMDAHICGGDDEGDDGCGGEMPSQGDSTLFFGCRRSNEDWIFRAEMDHFVGNKTLSHLYTAFSRQQEEKVMEWNGRGG